ncbi:hypothetical protein AB0M80_14420 [Amycolatopsis sp. NPDC051045]|uniref:hypothetical protein n=1 Tax=Amycolatopsis sp. NPDC051045 TaxID=3156922 RepID=UPI003419901E
MSHTRQKSLVHSAEHRTFGVTFSMIVASHDWRDLSDNETEANMTPIHRRAASALLAVIVFPWLTAESCEDNTESHPDTSVQQSTRTPIAPGGTPDIGGDSVTTSPLVGAPPSEDRPEATGLTITQPPATSLSPSPTTPSAVESPTAGTPSVP